MNNRILNQTFPNSASPIFHFRKPKPFLSPKFPSSSSNFYLFRSLLFHQTSIIKVNRDMNTNKIVNSFGIESYDDDLVIEASLTRILPPALTLDHGIVALKDALQEFKLQPPSSSSGLIRFQVAVPPSANSLNWFCCQPESTGVFPQFYISKQSDNPTSESALYSKTHGVFGIGAAVSFLQSPSKTDEWNLFRRYLLVDSFDITAYGFIDVHYDVKSSLMTHENGSMYFLVPQIELNECEDYCLLAGTLVWSESLLCNFEQALHSYEISLFQAINHIPAPLENCRTNFIHSTVQKFNVIEDEKMEMVYVEASMLGSCNSAASIVEMVSSSS